MGDKTENICRQMIGLYGGYVKAIVVNRIGSAASREDIEDCISDVFAELCRSPEKLPDSPSEQKALVSTIAKRRAIDHFRRLKLRGDSLSADETALDSAVSADDTEGELDSRQLRRDLWGAVEKLGEPDSSIIVYQYFYRKKVSEIAQLLSMTTAAVNKRSQRARQKLKEALAEQGY